MSVHQDLVVTMAEPPGPVINCSYNKCVDACTKGCCKNKAHTARPNFCSSACCQNKDHTCTFSVVGEWEMKEHKYMTHPFYCKRCDMDFYDYEDSLAHKVKSMVPWLVGERKDEKQKKLKHVVCEFCGVEFKSLGGRKLHQQQMHPADQKIVCKGTEGVWNAAEAEYVVETCGLTFSSGSAYMSHIENGMCRFIKRNQLEGERQHKRVLKDIMENPERFGANLRGKEHFLDEREKEVLKEHLDSFANGGAVPDGGVQLAGPMNNDDASQAASISPLQPVKLTQNLMDLDMTKPLERDKVLKAFPKLAIEGGLGGKFPTLSSTASSATTRPASNQMNVTNWPSLSPASGTHTEVTSVSGTASNASTVRYATKTAWGVRDASKILFPEAKDTPPPGSSQEAIKASKRRNDAEDRGTNLFTSRFWDSTSSDYDPTMFISTRLPNIGKFVCPWPECQAVFDVASEITSHIRRSHTSAPSRCEYCYKTFKNLTAILQHYESSARGGKCQIAKTSYFPRLLDEATGGFLSATKVQDKKIWGLPESEGGDVDESGLPATKQVDGVRSHQYEAHLPSHLAEPRW